MKVASTLSVLALAAGALAVPQYGGNFGGFGRRPQREGHRGGNREHRPAPRPTPTPKSVVAPSSVAASSLHAPSSVAVTTSASVSGTTPGSVAATTSASASSSASSLASSSASASASATATPVSQFNVTAVDYCLTNDQAQNIVTAFNWLLANPSASNFNVTAQTLMSSTYTDTSDSINQLAGLPEGTTTFASLDAFIAGSTSQAPLILDTLDFFSSCNAIAWRWISVSGTGNDAEKVKGIDTFYISPAGQIDSTYAEFNSGGWLADLGNPECTTTAATTTAASTTASSPAKTSATSVNA